MDRIVLKQNLNKNFIFPNLQSLDGLHLSGVDMHDILNELDLTYNGRLELSDYLQVNAMSDGYI